MAVLDLKIKPTANVRNHSVSRGGGGEEGEVSNLIPVG